MSDETPADAVGGEIIRYARLKLEENLSQISRCLGLLTAEQVWERPNEVSNSIGNLVVHLRGNVQQWIVQGIGGEPFNRDRAAEFRQRDILPTADILAALQDTVMSAIGVVESLDDEQLAQQYKIQGYQVSGVAAVFHVVEHFSFHTGQIIYWTKVITGQDLSLYDAQGQRLDGRSEGVP